MNAAATPTTVSSATVRPADRLGFTLFLAAALHVALILGVGFTLEYEIQMYFRRAKQLQISWNDTRRCEDLVAAAVLDAA